VPSRALIRVTICGCALPVVMFVVAVLVDSKPLAATALAAALFTPTMGHLLYRRILFTRGFTLRLVVAGIGGLIVAGATRERDLGTALGLVFVFGLLALAGFVTGAIFDLIDSARAVDSATKSRQP
jgi:hypothetical protein